MIADVEAFVRCFAPEVIVTGRVDPATPFELAPDESLLICSVDWAKLAERFDAALGSDRVFVLLEPEDYAWGHADFARSLPAWICGVVCTSEENITWL